MLFRSASQMSQGLLFAGVSCGAMMALFAYQSTPPALVRAQSNAGETSVKAQPEKKKMLRRHSSGDHAFLPNRQEKEAIRAAQKNFGVPSTLVQDSEGSRLPTTRGY